MHFNKIVFLLTTLVSGSSYAAAFSFLDHVQYSGAGGINWINTRDTHIDISAVETDSVRINSTNTNGTWKFGAGYFLFANRLLLELNVYGASNTIKGEVWQYELPQFDNYRFTAPISSTRLMLDVKPTVITWHKISPYPIVGVGATWNEVSYKERAMPGIDPSSELSLSQHTELQLAWDLGVGLSVEVSETVSLTAEYVYAFLGEAQPGSNPGEGRSMLEAPNFSYQLQSLLFGVCVRY